MDILGPDGSELNVLLRNPYFRPNDNRVRTRRGPNFRSVRVKRQHPWNADRLVLVQLRSLFIAPQIHRVLPRSDKR